MKKLALLIIFLVQNSNLFGMQEQPWDMWQCKLLLGSIADEVMSEAENDTEKEKWLIKLDNDWLAFKDLSRDKCEKEAEIEICNTETRHSFIAKVHAYNAYNKRNKQCIEAMIIKFDSMPDGLEEFLRDSQEILQSKADKLTISVRHIPWDGSIYLNNETIEFVRFSDEAEQKALKRTSSLPEMRFSKWRPLRNKK